MAKTDFQSVDEYISTFPADVQGVLQRVRRIIREAVPRAEEHISYQIPAYRVADGPVLYFAGWKQHYSLYPATAALTLALARELEPYEVRKGTIRFPLSAPVPVKLIARIAKLRAHETREPAEKKGASPKRSASEGTETTKKAARAKKRVPAKKPASTRRPLKSRPASKGVAARKPSAASTGSPGKKKKKSRSAKKRLPRKGA
jgi:uncharacterized protein YdhG (YjbR/CyaY superfamily)